MQSPIQPRKRICVSTADFHYFSLAKPCENVWQAEAVNSPPQEFPHTFYELIYTVKV